MHMGKKGRSLTFSRMRGFCLCVPKSYEHSFIIKVYIIVREIMLSFSCRLYYWSSVLISLSERFCCVPSGMVTMK